MGLVNIEQWRAERGLGVQFQGPPEPAGAEVSPDPAAALTAQIAALNQEITRQTDLIIRLQAALRPYAEEEARRRAALAAQARQAKSRVTRRARLPMAQRPSSPLPAQPVPAPPPTTPPQKE